MNNNPLASRMNNYPEAFAGTPTNAIDSTIPTSQGGVNWPTINSSATGIGTHVQNIAKSISGNGSIAKALMPHIANIQKSLAAIKGHPSNPANNSEADAGDMSNYDPNMGLGNKAPNSYSRTNK